MSILGGATFSLRRLGVFRSQWKVCTFLSFSPPICRFVFPSTRASSSSSKKKKEKPRRPIVQERHNTAAPREEEEEKEKEEAGSERRRDARDTPPERATLLGEDDDDDDDFFETFVGEKKGNGKVEVLLLLRFLSKGFSSDIFLVGRRRGPRGETRRSLFLSKKKKKKKKKSRIFCPFARRLGKARCSFDRVSFLRRPKLPRAP